MRNWQTLRADIMSYTGAERVYFQPPPAIQLRYPCIYMKCDGWQFEYGDNLNYLKTVRYQFTVMSTVVDDELFNLMAEYPGMSYASNYCSDGIYHYVFSYKQHE